MVNASVASADVAIVGLGPVGAALALMLARAGLSVRIVERETAIHPLPRAIHLDGEVMRVLLGLGLREPLAQVTRPGLKGMHFVDDQDRLLMLRAGTAALGPHGCANNHYFHQPDLEAVLRAALAQQPSVTTHLGTELTSLVAEPQAVALQVSPVDGSAPFTLRARYVVGCDGARSRLRAEIGSRLEDLDSHQAWLVFDAILRHDVGLPDYTVQHCDPRRPMTSCYVTGARRRWEIMLMPGDDPAWIARPENVWPMLSRWIRPEDATLERSVVYTFHAVLAHGWRRGRLLIAGDAAHQTPPFLGQGLCAGMRDAANLAWKLAAVIRDGAPDTLLDTYESERRPHARAFIELAVRLGEVIQATTPEAVARRDREFASGTRIFEFPAPGLGPGWREAVEPCGAIFPQPRLGDGRWLDEAIGDRFAVIGLPAAIPSLESGLTRLAPARRPAVIRADDTLTQAAAWLSERRLHAILLRPDRYIAAVAPTPADTVRLLDWLPGGGAAAPVG